MSLTLLVKSSENLKIPSHLMIDIKFKFKTESIGTKHFPAIFQPELNPGMDLVITESTSTSQTNENQSH